MPIFTLRPTSPRPPNAAEVQIIPQDRRGYLLQGAVVNGRQVVEDENSARVVTPMDGDGPMPFDLTITHFNRTVYDGTVTRGMLVDEPGFGNYSCTLQNLDTGYPESELSDAQAAWIGNTFYVWTQPPLARPDPETIYFSISDFYIGREDFRSHLFQALGTTTNSRGEIVSHTVEVDPPPYYYAFPEQPFTQSRGGNAYKYFYYGVQSAEGGMQRDTNRGGLYYTRPSTSSPPSADVVPAQDIRTTQTFTDVRPGSIFAVYFSAGPNEALQAAPGTEVTVIDEHNYVWGSGINYRMLVQVSGGEQRIVVEGVAGGASKTVVVNAGSDDSGPDSLDPSSLYVDNVRVHNTGRRDQAFLSWNTNGESTLAQTSDNVRMLDRNYTTVDNVTGDTEVTLRPMTLMGETGTPVTGTITPSPGDREPVVLCKKMLTSWTIAQGDTFTVPLAAHFYTEEDWSDIDFACSVDTVYRTAGSTPPDATGAPDIDASDTLDSATLASGDPGLSATGKPSLVVEAADDFTGTCVVFLSFRHDTKDPAYAAFAVTAGTSTERQDAVNTCGGAYSEAEGQTFDMSSFVGEYAEKKHVSSGAYKDAQASVSDGMATLGRSAEGDFGAVLCVYSGSWGHGVQVYTDMPEPIYQSPVLPEETIDDIEVDGTWESFDATQLAPHVYAGAQTRVLTDNNLLFSIRALRPPELLHFAPPVFFGTTWINEAEYPPDAQLVLEGGRGRVVYNGGLTTELTDPTPAELTSFTVTSTAYEVIAEWTLEAGGRVLTGPVEVTLRNASRGTDIGTRSGTNRVVFSDLTPGTRYAVQLFKEHERQTTTLYPIPEIEATAWRNTDNFTYEYDIGSAPNATMTFFDGTVYDGGGGETVEITSDEQVGEQEVNIVWGIDSDHTNQARTVRIPTQWRAPREPLSGTTSVSVGREITTQGAGDPLFSHVSRRGEKLVDFGSNVYPKGTIRFEPYGYLPALLPGALEDYIEIQTVKPDGTVTGPEVQLERQTELQVQAKVKSEDGMSPVFSIRVTRRLAV